MFASLISDLPSIEFLLSRPWLLLMLAFQIWMLVDAIRRREWIWAVLIFFFSAFTAIFYYFLVYRREAPLTRGFELPGAHQRKRIKELEAQIHHLDKAHHHSQLGDIYFQQGKLQKAEACYRAALERDPQDLDTRAHLGHSLLRQNRAQEAQPLLESVAAENPKHDYGHSLMALAETLAALGEIDSAIQTWERVLQDQTYARARVQLADLYLKSDNREKARVQLQEVLADEAHAPGFQRKRERIWIRRAKSLLRQI